jgi:4-hydroxythreonine-4-phosphate dehydrogenase
VLSAAIIADDLTGAADCAAAFAVSGLPAFVALGETSPPSEGVIAWDTDSRAATPKESAARVEAAAQRALDRGARVLYKKIDSTLRGHVGPEVAALLRAATRAGGRAIVIAAPSFPAQGRTMSGGRVRVDSVPRGEVDLPGLELLRPPGGGDSGDLAAMLAGQGLRTARASVAELRAGELDSTADAVVCDAEDEADLRRIAELGAALPGRVIWVGSGGLARHLPETLGLRPAEQGLPAFEPRAGPLLVLVGSRSAAAREQMRILCAEPGVQGFELDPGALLAGEGTAGWNVAAERPDHALAAGGDVVLLLARQPAIDPGAARALAAALGRFAAPLAARASGLLATGGDTARALLLALGATGMHLCGEVEPGVPLGFLDAPRRLPLVTKAGAFGNASTLSRCRAALRGGKS